MRHEPLRMHNFMGRAVTPPVVALKRSMAAVGGVLGGGRVLWVLGGGWVLQVLGGGRVLGGGWAFGRDWALGGGSLGVRGIVWGLGKPPCCILLRLRGERQRNL